MHRFGDETSRFSVFVNLPPDMRQEDNRRLLDDVVDALNAHELNNVRFARHTFETQTSCQVESTVYWMRNYLRYLSDHFPQAYEQFSYRHLPQFIAQRHTFWVDMLRLNETLCAQDG